MKLRSIEIWIFNQKYIAIEIHSNADTIYGKWKWTFISHNTSTSLIYISIYFLNEKDYLQQKCIFKGFLQHVCECEEKVSYNLKWTVQSFFCFLSNICKMKKKFCLLLRDGKNFQKKKRISNEDVSICWSNEK